MITSRHLSRSLFTLFVLTIVVVLVSCSKRDVEVEEPVVSGSGAEFSEETAVESSAAGATTAIGSDALQTVYFDFDQYNIRSDAEAALRMNVEWLRQNPSSTIQIEGHCDERGTIEYNIALGERRADAIKNYMSRMGIDSSRISTISYGEERPSNPSSSESAWAENRRAEFVVLSR